MEQSTKHSIIKTIYLVGNPNTGKSSLFNALTGLTQKIGNFPGVTVDKKTGFCTINNKQVEVVDLPGTYTLKPTSEDEKVAVDNIKAVNQESLIIVIADVTNLKRNLLLCSQIIDLGKPVLLVLNMMDLLERNKQTINIDLLSKHLGIPIVPANAKLNKGVNALKETISTYNFSSVSFLEKSAINGSVDETILRYKKISSIIQTCFDGGTDNKFITLTKKIDNIITHKFYGYAIFLGILFLIFQAIFSWSAYPMELIEQGFLLSENFVSKLLPQGLLNDLIVNGIIAGLSGIVVFVPQIAML
ncbi:MAG: ferrous iron transporter B, partial [Flavobacteriales bacterium]|nr:ferrous iron transporter B [Flavobacteriales bacterium]